MYKIDDCLLVRKTTVFPDNGVVETPVHGLAYGFGTSSLLGDAIRDKLLEKELDMDTFTSEFNKYNIYFETFRSTIHFTINGVVADSMYGVFDYPYAILEPLKHHISDSSLKTLRVEDTYFSDDLQLSSDAIILVPEDKIDEVREKHNLEGLNIRLYSGNIEDAIKSTMIELGYQFFDVNDHGYRDGLDSGTDASHMYQFIYEFAKSNNISQERHFYSDINYQDQQKRSEEGEKIDLMHLHYILDEGGVNDELVEKINELLPYKNYYRNEFNQLMRILVEEVGLLKLQELTNNFNNMMIEDRKRRKSVKK